MIGSLNGQNSSFPIRLWKLHLHTQVLISIRLRRCSSPVFPPSRILLPARWDRGCTGTEVATVAFGGGDGVFSIRYPLWKSFFGVCEGKGVGGKSNCQSQPSVLHHPGKEIHPLHYLSHTSPWQPLNCTRHAIPKILTILKTFERCCLEMV
jgi:hypothetical protein